MNSVHDIAIEEFLLRPLPPAAIPLPDLTDVYLRFCRYFYGDDAKEAGKLILESQKKKGLECYGEPLTCETKIDAHLELLSELADAICYLHALPLPDSAKSVPAIRDEEPERTINFAISFAIDAISALPIETRRSKIALELLRDMLNSLGMEAQAASGEDFVEEFEEDELHA